MALLGSSIDPRLFVQDYSGYANAAKIDAKSMEGLGQTVENNAKAAVDYFKDQDNKKNLIKQSSTQIEAAIKLAPELQGVFSPILNNIRDENISLNDRFAEAGSAPALIEFAIGKLYKDREFGLKDQELNMRQNQSSANDYVIKKNK